MLKGSGLCCVDVCVSAYLTVSECVCVEIKWAVKCPSSSKINLWKFSHLCVCTLCAYQCVSWQAVTDRKYCNISGLFSSVHFSSKQGSSLKDIYSSFSETSALLHYQFRKYVMQIDSYSGWIEQHWGGIYILSVIPDCSIHTDETVSQK